MPRGAFPGERRGGRQKGTPNKVTANLRDAILEAAQEVGLNGFGQDGLKGYLKAIAIEDKKAYSSLLGRVLPLQVGGDPDGIPMATKNEVVVALVTGTK